MRRREEARFEREVLAHVGGRPDVALFKNEVGQGYYGAVKPVLLAALAPFGAVVQGVAADVLIRHRVTYGLHVGSSDLIGVAAPLGRLVAIELKSATGVLAPDQHNFIARMRALGAIAGEARTLGDVERMIASAGGG